MQNPRRFSLIICCLLMSLLSVQAAAKTATTNQISFSVNREYCRTILNKVDKLVRTKFFDKSLMEKEWPKALKANEANILSSRNIAELSERLNVPIHALHSSHCQFATANDEIFYFLHDLFASFTKKGVKNIDLTGAITGGVNCSKNQVRYVLEGSPAWVAGIVEGDIVKSVDGKPYVGQSNFWNKSGSMVRIGLLREGKPLTVQLKPLRKDCYQAYVDAIEKSVKVTKLPNKSIGYVRFWCGGTEAHDKFEEVLGSEKIQSTSGLIVDLRDGYGGNYFTDLDYFYRPAAAYPALQSSIRSGSHYESLTYDKPLVFLINGGSRSGKELLAYSLKKTGRAKLVGENTAGAVLAGQLFSLDDRCALYLAVASGKVDGVNLEGKGVSPDIEVKSACNRSTSEQQLAIAEATLLDMVKAMLNGAN
jgi:carboxyl-terminal processing protease